MGRPGQQAVICGRNGGAERDGDSGWPKVLSGMWRLPKQAPIPGIVARVMPFSAPKDGYRTKVGWILEIEGTESNGSWTPWIWRFVCDSTLPGNGSTSWENRYGDRRTERRGEGGRP